MLISNSLKKAISKGLILGPKWRFLYLKPVLSAIFVTIATIKINQSEEIVEKQQSDFGSGGGGGGGGKIAP